MLSEEMAQVKLQLLKLCGGDDESSAPLRSKLASLEAERHRLETELHAHLALRSKVEKFLHGQEVASSKAPNLIMNLSINPIFMNCIRWTIYYTIITSFT